MRGAYPKRWWLAASIIAACLGIPAAATARFTVGLEDPGFQIPPTLPRASVAYQAMARIGGSSVRVGVPWSVVAPSGKTLPPGFNPTNPGDPNYNWRATDAAVRNVASHHLSVMLSLATVPQWAQRGDPPAEARRQGYPWNPDPKKFAQFARAAALRYSGRFPDPLVPGARLPRVRLWEIWNEENLPYDLAAPNVVEEYRSLLNAGYAQVKRVHSDNVVAVGGLAPVSFLGNQSISPLRFGADLLCLRRTGRRFVRQRRCVQRANFDVFGIHPYSVAATPTKHAYRYDDVLVGDMNKISSLVRAAERLHTVGTRVRHQIWVSEWSWFTNPPDPQVGDPDRVAARYVQYSMYEMWRAGVTLVIWFLAEDVPANGPNTPGLLFGGGLYTSSGRPKLMLSALAFPFVASISHGHGFAWGRAPTSGGRRTAIIERRAGRRWRRIGTTRTGGDGVFLLRFRARANGVYRARVGTLSSLPYDSTRIPPRRTHLFNSG